jgi:mevalonate kinase
MSDDNNMEEDFQKYMEGDIKKKRQSFEWPNTLIPVLIFTGQPSSTQELIKKVMDYKKKEPKEYSNFISTYNKINMKAKEAFESNNILTIKTALEESWEMRKVLGDLAKASIEPGKTTLFIDELKKNGAFIAGLIGAGGGDSILALCKEEDDKDRLIKYLEKKNMPVLETISIVNQGYRLLK